MKDKTPSRILTIFRYTREKYAHYGFLLRVRRELARSDHPSGRLPPAARIPRSRSSPKTTILFFPDAPTDESMAFNLCAGLGYAITTNPNDRWDVAFKWRDETFFDRSLLDWLPKDIPMINRESVDISKTAVDRAMLEVFGYCAAVDPTQYAGLVVQKSNLNGTHDGRVIHGPVPPGSLRAGYVYQRLIDNTFATDIVYAYRVPIHGQRIPVVSMQYRPTWRRFGSNAESRRFHVGNYRRFAEPDQVFSDDELRKIFSFVRHVQLDYGALDILRDSSDGRIFVVDANNTPFGWRRRRPSMAYSRSAQSFAEMIQEFRRRDVATTRWADTAVRSGGRREPSADY